MKVYAIAFIFLCQTLISPTPEFNDKIYPLNLAKYEICKQTKRKKIKQHNKSKSFKENYYNICKEVSNKYNIPIEIILGQAALESYYGTSELAINGNNYFGIRKGKNYKRYTNKYDSFHDYGKILQNKRYKFLYELDTVEEWAYGLKKAGYAEDPKYPIKLIETIKSL